MERRRSAGVGAAGEVESALGDRYRNILRSGRHFRFDRDQADGNMVITYDDDFFPTNCSVDKVR